MLINQVFILKIPVENDEEELSLHQIDIGIDHEIIIEMNEDRGNGNFDEPRMETTDFYDSIFHLKLLIKRI